MAAVPFELDVRNENISEVHNKFKTFFPNSILDNLDGGFFHLVDKSELVERQIYDLKKKQTSLFLELAGNVKKRDAIMLQNYTDYELKRKIKESEAQIEKCKKSLDEVSGKIKEVRINSNLSTGVKDTKKRSEGEKFLNLLKNMVVSEDVTDIQESVKLYGNDESHFLNLSETALENGLDSPEAEREIVGSNVHSVLSGKVTVVGDYISVSAKVMLYPGRRVICTVSEIGTFDDMDYISQSLSQNILPLISGSLPANLNVHINSEVPLHNLIFSIDDNVVSNFSETIIIESGAHNLSFEAEGFKSLYTSYWFEGNQTYSVDVEMVPLEDGYLNFKILFPSEGNVYANGILSANVSEDYPCGKISINGNRILGQFVSTDGKSLFFYSDNIDPYNENYVGIKGNLSDIGTYIEKRRKIMYGGYSAFVVSLMGYCITKGGFDDAYATALRIPITDERYEKLRTQTYNWYYANTTFTVLTISSAVFWAYSLVRYLIAADKVLPSKVKVLTADDFTEYENKKTKEINIEDFKIEEIDEQIQ